MIKLITPEINNNSLQFIHENIREISNPFYVTVKTEKWAKEKRCMDNVLKKIKLSQGQRSLGWIIWEWPNVYYIAEYHSIWVGINGDKFDITPHAINVDKILGDYKRFGTIIILYYDLIIL